MKKSILLIVLLMIGEALLSDSTITRGTAVGEIYFLGPTATGKGLYHSTDFGETATCMDSTLDTNINIGRITADLTQGVVYGYSMPENLWISYIYGQDGSWIFRSNATYYIQSGRTEGYIYKGFSQHSEDYGITFENHECNGNFGNSIDVEIDAGNNIGYKLTYESGNLDSLWLLISEDNFENFEIQHVFCRAEGNPGILTRGFESGELYLTRGLSFGDASYSKELWYSDDYGKNWYFKNYIRGGIVGGRQPGEIYMITSYTLFLGERKHIYIYHSIDYGETFTEYHPFAYGPEPFWADFEADITSGTAPLTVNFSDLSEGEEIYAWEWDFDLDGNIDSYEQNPEYTYQEPGCYTVELKIYFFGEFRGYVKRNYIQVTDGNENNENVIQKPQFTLQNYPNPFNPITTISFSTTEGTENTELNIYNVKGQRIDELRIKDEGLRTGSVVWDASGFASGIYFYGMNVQNSPIKKMIFLK